MTPGEVLAGYRLLELLGEGGEGQVFLAESTDGLGKRVALKRFAPGARDRFARELEAYRQVEALRRGPGSELLAEGLAAGELPDGGGYLVLAWQPGGTLADRVRARGPLQAPEAVRLTCELLRGLELLHGAGLCHRDVKPGNVLLTAEGGVRLGDFGLVRGREGTISGGGTPAFAAPEQLAVDDRPGAAPAPREGVPIDVYGAGATLHYLLTGRSPPPGRPDLFLLEAREVPRGVQRELLRALQTDPRLRHPDAASFARSLEAALPRAAAANAPRAGWGAGSARKAAALVLAAAAVAWIASRGAPRPPPAAPATADAPPPVAGVALPATAVAAQPAPDAAPPPPPATPAATGATAPEDPCTLLLDCAGEVTRVALPAAAVVILPVSARDVAVGTSAGEVLLVRAGEPPRSLHRFGHEVLRLALEDGRLIAEGDDRRPRTLAAGEAARADELEVEGALGRWAFPRRAAPARVALELGRAQ